MELEFPKDINFSDYYLTLYPKFLEVGQRHVHIYTTQAQDGDPASRLALRVIGKRADGTSLDLYLSRIFESAVEKANAFVDRILEGINEDELKSRPRRLFGNPGEPFIIFSKMYYRGIFFNARP
jgi:hypothetical protein